LIFAVFVHYFPVIGSSQINYTLAGTPLLRAAGEVYRELNDFTGHWFLTMQHIEIWLGTNRGSETNLCGLPWPLWFFWKFYRC